MEAVDESVPLTADEAAAQVLARMQEGHGCPGCGCDLSGVHKSDCKWREPLERILVASPEPLGPENGGGDDTYEVSKVIEAWGLGFCLGNTVKCVSRAGRKPGADALEDLRKASWYLNCEIERIQIEQIERAVAGE